MPATEKTHMHTHTQAVSAVFVLDRRENKASNKGEDNSAPSGPSCFKLQSKNWHPLKCHLCFWGMSKQQPAHIMKSQSGPCQARPGFTNYTSESDWRTVCHWLMWLPFFCFHFLPHFIHTLCPSFFTSPSLQRPHPPLLEFPFPFLYTLHLFLLSHLPHSRQCT